MRLLFSVVGCFMHISAFAEIEHDMHLRDFRYTVNLITKDESGLFSSFMEMFSESDIEYEIKNLRTFKLQNQTVSSLRALKERVKADEINIYKAAKVLGFYNVKVNTYYTTRDSDVAIDIVVDLGPVFQLKTSVNYCDMPKELADKFNERVSSFSKQLKASYVDIKTVIDYAIKDLQKNGYASPEIKKQRLSIEFDEQSAALSLKILSGKQVKFANTNIKAFPGIDEQFIRNRIDWSKGEQYDIEKIEKTAEALRDTQIFSKIKVEPDLQSVRDNYIDMDMKLEEDKKHTIEVSAMYTGMNTTNVDKGSTLNKSIKSIVTKFSWKRHNAFGNGEVFSMNFKMTPMKIQKSKSYYEFAIDLTQPDVFIKNCTANYAISREQELTNAFFKRGNSIYCTLMYPLREDILCKLRLTCESNNLSAANIFTIYNTNTAAPKSGTNTKDTDFYSKYNCIFAICDLVYNKTNDLLNPTSGYKISASIKPYLFNKLNISSMILTDISGSYYHPLNEFHKTVFVVNAAYKKIIASTKLDAIPLDKRIYAGGLHSARGFANQMATEVVQGTDIPFGGMASFEVSTELRHKFTNTIGGVIFADCAKILQNCSSAPALKIEKKRIFMSYGVGMRYYTSFGPVRVEFAFPVNRRKKVDSKMQFIISLGQ